MLRDRGSDVVLRVVGAVHRTGAADAKEASRLLGDAVSFTGYVSPERLARELRTAHVLAFPSLFEGFGIPVLEAMVAGLPVAVSDRTSLPEVVADAGLICPASDAFAWAESLAEAMGSRASELAASGRRRQADFNWARTATIVSSVLESVAGRSPSSRR
jgi:glycosyltransferase involved in cell wall biosynthesis